MRKFFKSLCIALALSIVTCTSAFAMENNSKNTLGIITPYATISERAFQTKYLQLYSENVKLWGLNVGTVKFTVPTIYEEVWLVDGNGNKLEYLRKSTYFDTSRSMAIDQISSVPFTTVTVKDYSFTRTSASVTATATSLIQGTSEKLITVYPVQK